MIRTVYRLLFLVNICVYVCGERDWGGGDEFMDGEYCEMMTYQPLKVQELKICVGPESHGIVYLFILSSNIIKESGLLTCFAVAAYLW